VSLVGTADFDVKMVTLSTVLVSRADCVGGAVAPVWARLNDPATPFPGNPCDCHALHGDGIVDLSLKFDRVELEQALLLNDFSHGDSVELVVVRS
jgi:hypothetical protein